MFRTVPPSVIRSLFTVHSAMVYVIQVCRQFSSRTRMELQFHPGPARKLSTNLYDIPLLSVEWINSWWRTEELPETCRFSCQNEFVKLVHLVGLIIKKINLNMTSKTMENKYVQCQFRWPCHLSCMSAAAPLLGSRVRIPLRACSLVFAVCCVGSDICD